MTPAELNIHARAYATRQQARQEASQINLYSLSALIRTMIWSKHPPSYEKAYPKKNVSGQQSDEELYAQVRALNALFGGKELS